MTLVLKVDCRACNRECGDYKHLLDETVIDDESTTLAALLNYCTTLECFGENHEPGMPEHICNSCVEHLIQSYLFKEMVLQNDRAYRERLQAEAQERIKSELAVAEEIQCVEQEIDIGGIEEEANVEEFISENEENTEDSHKENREFEYEEWLEVDELASESNEEAMEIQEEIVRNEEEIIVRNEADEENCGFVVSALEDSDSGEALKGFEEDSKEEIRIENYEMQEEETSNDDTKRETKPAKRRSLKVRD